MPTHGLILAPNRTVADDMVQEVLDGGDPPATYSRVSGRLRWDDGSVAYVHVVSNNWEADRLRGLSLSWAWCHHGLMMFSEETQMHVRMALRENPAVLVAGPDEIPKG